MCFLVGNGGGHVRSFRSISCFGTIKLALFRIVTEWAVKLWRFSVDVIIDGFLGYIIKDCNGLVVCCVLSLLGNSGYPIVSVVKIGRNLE